jgi:hypothetical protein
VRHIQQQRSNEPIRQVIGQVQVLNEDLGDLEAPLLSTCILPFLSAVRLVAMPVAASTVKSTGLSKNGPFCM